MQRILLIICCFSAFSVQAQNSVQEILQLVLQNNKTLKAAADKTETEKQELMLETSLDNPEVGFDYLWGKPGMIGKRKDVNINQTFDLSTVFGYRKSLAKSQKELLDLELQQKQLETRIEVLDLLAQITYYNKALGLYEERLAQEQQLAQAYEKRLAAGDANKLDVNRVRLSLTGIEAETSTVKTERDLLLLELKTLCGGAEVAFSETDYSNLDIESASGFGQTISSLTEAQNAQTQTIAEKDLKLTKSQYLPSITAGYMAELTDDDKWNGITVGVSIPLWQNRNNLKRAKLQVQSARSEAEDAAYKLEQAIAAQRLRTESLQEIAKNMQQKLANASSTALLRKALNEGEISLIEYTLENSEIFEMRIKALETERDYQQAKLLLQAL